MPVLNIRIPTGEESVTSGTRLATWWAAARDSLWFVPGLITLGAVVLSFVTVWLDRFAVPGLSSTLFELLGGGERGAVGLLVFFGGGAAGARGVLSAIATGFITVTGVIFSITILALQLASTYFTPRVLRNFTADRASQVVLGIFIATFTYALLVQRTIRPPTGNAPGFVPALSVTVAVALALVAVVALIFFINHMAREIQAETIIDQATRTTLDVIERRFPDPAGSGSSAGSAEPPVPKPEAESAAITSRSSGYIQALDGDALTRLAAEEDLVLHVEPRVSDYILPGMSLVSVWPADAAADDALANSVRETFILGTERTNDQDVSFGVTQLVDIAVKGMSPAINDPTTAVTCLDHIGEILVALGRRPAAPRIRTDADGKTRLIVRSQPFGRTVRAGFTQIRNYSTDDPFVTYRILKTLDRVARLVPEGRRPPLLRQAEATLRQARRANPDPEDLRMIERAGEWVEEVKAEEGR